MLYIELVTEATQAKPHPAASGTFSVWAGTLPGGTVVQTFGTPKDRRVSIENRINPKMIHR